MTTSAIGGARSDRRRRWRGRPRPDVTPQGDWPDAIGRLLALRGLATHDAARDFLAPPAGIPNPYCLPDLDIAIERLLRAVGASETVAIFGDFDVDGVTSAAQLAQAIASLGGVAMPYVPDRFTEGYGLNVGAIARLHSAGATLLITADCGTSSVDEVAAACALGMDVIILDHHTVPPVLPDALALVNPKRIDANAGALQDLATAGLAFHVASALHMAANREFDASAYLDLAALGTVCDMAPLTHENRRLLRTGLPALAATHRPGLRALMEISRTAAATVSAEDIGYRLGPRLNAAGRIAHAKLALELLSTGDDERGRDLARQLDTLNRERQDRTTQAMALAQEMIGVAEPPALIMIGHPDFSSGIVGLIASKLVNAYGRPAIVYERGETESRASCRSIDDFDITAALRKHAGLFVRFGGHRAAAGFTVENEHLDAVRSALIEKAESELAGRELAPILDIDANLPLRALRGEEVRWLSRLGPFGIGNPQPLFLARNVTVIERRWMGNGEQHRRLRLRDADGGPAWTALAFDMPEIAIEEGTRLDLVYSVESTGRADGTLELRLEDARPAE